VYVASFLYMNFRAHLPKLYGWGGASTKYIYYVPEPEEYLTYSLPPIQPFLQNNLEINSDMKSA
jgi:hypothetical protein